MTLATEWWAVPGSPEEAWALTERSGGRARFAAGCTQATPRSLVADRHVALVVDLLTIPQLQELRADDDRLTVGAAVSVRDLATSDVVEERAPALTACCRGIGDEVLQRHATIGGNVALRGTHLVELATVLVALGGEVEWYGGEGRERVSCDVLCEPPVKDTLLVAFHIPRARGPWAYRKLIANTPAYGLGAVAVQNDPRHGPRVVVNPGSGLPQRLGRLEDMLAGQPPRETLRPAAVHELEGITFPSDSFGSERYRRHAIGVLMGDALEEVGSS